MNADRLLALYEQVAEAPDAVTRLRRFVLDLAVRGKLVPQDASDEPASELVKHVEKKRKADESGRKRKPAVLEPTPFDGELYDLPRGWEWVALAAISDVTMGQSPPGNTYNTVGDGVPLINGPVEFTEGPFGKTVVNQFTTAPTNFCEEGDLLICVRGSTTGRTNIAAFKACIGRGVAAIRSAFDDKFIRLFLWKSREDIIAMGRGIAFPSVSKNQIEDLAVPLPPLAEQRRVVAKVEELMALLDRLEAARTAREATRDRLTAASLARLTSSDTGRDADPHEAEPGKVGTGFPSGSATTKDSFPANVRFALATLPALTTRPDQIKPLRQAILNLAVRGKLVEQDPEDEPASELLKRIAAEKKRQGVKHSIVPLGDEEVPLELPSGWSWTRVGEICLKTGSGSTPRGGKDVYKKSGIPFLRSQNVYNDGLRLDDVAFIDAPTHERMKGTRVLPGDLLLNITGGSMGRCSRVPDTFGDANISQHVAIIRPAVSGMEAFLHSLVLSPYFQAFIFDEQTGAGRAGLPKSRMDKIAVALPPLAEQHRIVAKVDALMTLCDRLEVGLTTADTTRARLLKALLHETLAQAGGREREAAE